MLHLVSIIVWSGSLDLEVCWSQDIWSISNVTPSESVKSNISRSEKVTSVQVLASMDHTRIYLRNIQRRKLLYSGIVLGASYQVLRQPSTSYKYHLLRQLMLSEGRRACRRKDENLKCSTDFGLLRTETRSPIWLLMLGDVKRHLGRMQTMNRKSSIGRHTHIKAGVENGSELWCASVKRNYREEWRLERCKWERALRQVIVLIENDLCEEDCTAVGR